jgi:hypothetical protein
MSSVSVGTRCVWAMAAAPRIFLAPFKLESSWGSQGRLAAVRISERGKAVPDLQTHIMVILSLMSISSMCTRASKIRLCVIDGPQRCFLSVKRECSLLANSEHLLQNALAEREAPSGLHLHS